MRPPLRYPLLAMNRTLGQKGLFHVRPDLLLLCAAFVLLAVSSLGGLPDLIRRSLFAQGAILLAASAAIAVGWFCTAKYSEPNSAWRASIALITSVYLTVSIPAYFLAVFSTLGWLLHHHVLWAFLRPWARWGYVTVYMAFAGSFFGRGRARIAFVLGATLLLILWESTGRWL